MKKLYTLREASDYLGLTESTLRGWINETHLSVVMLGRTLYIDSESLEELKCPTEGVVRLKLAIDSLRKKQASELRRVRENALTETVFRKFLSECSDKCVMYGLFQTLLRMLNNSGELSDMEFRIMSSLLAGDSMALVAGRYNVSDDEIRDICIKALDKVRKTRKTVSEINNTEQVLPGEKSYMETVPGVVVTEPEPVIEFADEDSAENIRTEESTLPEQESRESILQKRIADCPGLSVRTRNVLHSNCYLNGHLIKGETVTIGELVSLRRSDVCNMRRCGRKTVEELDTLITGFGLEWKEESPDKRCIIKKKGTRK